MLKYSRVKYPFNGSESPLLVFSLDKCACLLAVKVGAEIKYPHPTVIGQFHLHSSGQGSPETYILSSYLISYACAKKIKTICTEVFRHLVYQLFLS